jgi:hypothetical protein
MIESLVTCIAEEETRLDKWQGATVRASSFRRFRGDSENEQVRDAL